MDKVVYESVKEKTLSILTELGIVDIPSLVKAGEVLKKKEDSSLSEARLYLLKIVNYYASNCKACDRHKQRVNPNVYEGNLDLPMLIYDYPTYVDTMASKPLAGLPEILLSKCGNCLNIDNHFKDAIYPNNRPLVPVEGLCNYEPVEKQDNLIQLSSSFQGPGKALNMAQTPGQILDRILLDINLSRASWSDKPDVYITSSLLCPSIAEDGSNNPVKAKDRKACSPWLDLQIDIVDPPIIVCLGLEAMLKFYPKTGLTTKVGTLETINNRKIGVTWHPSTVIRNANNQVEANRFFEDIKNHLKEYLIKERK